MIVVLIVVYVLIGFQKGFIGVLFIEFVFIFVGVVIVLVVVVFMLLLMMCVKFFCVEQDDGCFVKFIDYQFECVQYGYKCLFYGMLLTWLVVIVMFVLLLLVIIVLGMMVQLQLVLEEDQGIVVGQIVGVLNVIVQQMNVYVEQMFVVVKKLLEYEQMFQFIGVLIINQGIGGVLFKLWDQCSCLVQQLQQELQQVWNGIVGVQVVVFQFLLLLGVLGLLIQMVIIIIELFENFNEVVSQVFVKVQVSGKFYFIDLDLKVDKLQVMVLFDCDMIILLGLIQQDIGVLLGVVLGGGYVNYFLIFGCLYCVILQVLQVDCLNLYQVLDYYINMLGGEVIQVFIVVKIKYQVVL